MDYPELGIAPGWGYPESSGRFRFIENLDLRIHGALVRFLQMPMMFARRIRDISLYNIPDHSTTDIYCGTTVTRIGLMK